MATICLNGRMGNVLLVSFAWILETSWLGATSIPSCLCRRRQSSFSFCARNQWPNERFVETQVCQRSFIVASLKENKVLQLSTQPVALTLSAGHIDSIAMDISHTIAQRPSNQPAIFLSPPSRSFSYPNGARPV